MKDPAVSNQAMPRRTVLRSLALCSAGIALGGTRIASADDTKTFRIEEPVQGAVLHRRLGRPVEKGLEIEVSGIAPPGAQVLVQGRPATRDGGEFRGTAVLKDRETKIVAELQSEPAQKTAVRVVFDRNSFPRYRFSLDDNSFFLRDIFQKSYRSLFDCFYLALLRDLHKKYGVKFTVNIYYTTGDGFDISQFPDRYRGEWRDCADWLKLAFHAYADKPARPYQDAPPEKLLGELDLVAEEIHRFAGSKSYAPPTVIHWGMTRQEALKPLYEHGVRALSGYFHKNGGQYDVNYRFDDVVSEYLSRHDAWKDFQSGIVFSSVDLICNSVPNDQIAATLEPLSKDPNHAEIMDLFTHEQYFWPFYEHYIPDHSQRLDTAIRWVTEHGYKPVFYHEGFLGAPK